jgi:hypothetical protein
VEQVVVGPVACLDDGAALEVPGQAVGVAGPFGDDLEPSRARVDPPQGAGESVVPAAGPDPAGVEDPIEAVEPTVGPPGERTGQFVDVGPPETGDDNFGPVRPAVVVVVALKRRSGALSTQAPP